MCRNNPRKIHTVDTFASTPTEMLQQTNSEIKSVTSSHDSVKSSAFFLCAMNNDAG